MRMLEILVAAVPGLPVAVFGLHAWISLDGAPMTSIGHLSVALGALSTLAVGAGLIALMYYSNAAGFDDGAAVGTADHDADAGKD